SHQGDPQYFSFRGNARHVVTLGDLKQYDNGESNRLDRAYASNGALYLLGQVARGRDIEGMGGPLHQDYFMLKLDLIQNDVLWTKSFADQANLQGNVFFHAGENEFFIVSPDDPRNISVVRDDGAETQAPLSIPDGMYNFNGSDVELSNANTARGFL